MVATMPRKLTSKQEAYKNNRIKGMGCSAAYRAAYACEKMNDNAVSKEATKLEQDPRIAPEIKVKREEVTEKAVEAAAVTLQDVITGLLGEAKDKTDGSSHGARVTAWKALGEHTGGFDANRQKLDINGEVTFNMDFGGGDE